jgi:hypothetical protein
MAASGRFTRRCHESAGSIRRPQWWRLTPKDKRVAKGAAAYKARLDQLKARARKLGMTIRASRGTGYGYFHLGRPNSLLVSTACHGLDEVENWLGRIEAELDDLAIEEGDHALAKPSDQRLDKAQSAAGKKYYEERSERFLASKRPTCEFCEQPSDGSDEYRVGPEDVYWWVHTRCHEAFKERNRRRLEEQGYVGGIKMTVLGR